MEKSLEERLAQITADDEAYKAGKLPKQHVRRTRDASGNLIREKAMVYYGESFEEALIREATENET